MFVTPELVLEVAEAGEDYVITSQELNSVMGTIAGIFMGVATAGFVAMLMGAIAKGFTEETGIETKKIAGIPVPIGFGG